jgi:flagellar protein FlbD
MIELTRLNDAPFYLNADHIWLIEATPDTVITMISGERLVVAQPVAEVVARFMAYKRAIATGPASTVSD